jgi:hypothetical protein
MSLNYFLVNILTWIGRSMCPCLDTKCSNKRSYTSNNGIKSINIHLKQYFWCKWKPSTLKKKIGVENFVKFSQNIGSLIEFTFVTKNFLQFPQLCYLKKQNFAHKTLFFCISSCPSLIVDSWTMIKNFDDRNRFNCWLLVVTEIILVDGAYGE